MRINTNIAALNSHRMLEKNTSISGRNLEKLSSGKRINRASDDAAGLAISEKMNAQIRGLKMASRNALDGVSLVQTAEGAMGEVHSMLQRMRELSVQAANGTMSTEDRRAIQDEINQLTSEVNRIGNGTEFNNLNILQGNQEPNSNATVGKMSTGLPATIKSLPLDGIDSSSDIYKVDISNKTLSIEINGRKTEVNLQGFTGDSNTTLSANELLGRINEALLDDAYAVFSDDMSIIIRSSLPGGGQNIKLEGNAVNTIFGVSEGVINSFGKAENAGGISQGNMYFSDIPQAGSYIIIGDQRIDFFDSSKEPYIGSNKSIDVHLAKPEVIKSKIDSIVNTQPYQPQVPGTLTSPINIAIPNLDSTFSNGDKITIGLVELELVSVVSDPTTQVQLGATTKDTIENINNVLLNGTIPDYVFSIDSAKFNTSNQITTALADLPNKTFAIGSETYEFTLTGSVSTPGNIPININGLSTMNEALVELSNTINNASVGLVSSTDGTNLSISSDEYFEVMPGTITFSGNTKPTLNLSFEGKYIGTSDPVNKLVTFDVDSNTISGNFVASIGTPEVIGDTSITFENQLNSGDKLQFGDIILVAGQDFEIGADINETADNLKTILEAEDKINVVTIGTITADKWTLNINHAINNFDISLENSLSSSRDDISKIIDRIVDNISVTGVEILKNPINSQELIIKADQAGLNGNLINLEGTLKEFNVNLQVGSNTGQGFRLEVGDVRSRAIRISSDKPTGNPGVLGASYVKIPNVTNGISAASVEYSLDVMDEKKATAAIEVFNNAIITVASERSKLGAIQNRLEKTIANLDNTAENLTAAKSRIEDTDMALEMSEFTKFNILQQAGTAMLSQANQQPQMMLKLLNA